MRWSTKSGKGIQRKEKRKLILENAVALLLEFYCGESAFFLRKAFIPYSPELAAGQMVRFFFLGLQKIRKTMELSAGTSCSRKLWRRRSG